MVFGHQPRDHRLWRNGASLAALQWCWQSFRIGAHNNTFVAMNGWLQVPGTRLAYVLSTLEQSAGLLLSALLLGIVVTKASVPTSKLIFSKVGLQHSALIAPAAKESACLNQHSCHAMAVVSSVHSIFMVSDAGLEARLTPQWPTQTCVMHKRDGVWTLMCRVGNARGNFLYSPEIRMCYLCPMTSREGERLWEVQSCYLSPAPVL